MTEIQNTDKPITRLSIKIGADDYVRHCNNVEVIPTRAVTTFKGGNPEAHSHGVGSPAWILALSFVHDYNNPDSLYRFLLENGGETAEFTYKPDRDGDLEATVTAVIIEPRIGNAVDTKGTSTLQLPCSLPVYGDPTVVVPAITGLTPDTALAAGGELIVITGTGFTGATSVTIDGETAEFILVNSRTIHAVVPAASAGDALVIVTNSAGASPAASLTLTA